MRVVRTTLLKDTLHQSYEAVLSLQSASCGRSRAQTEGEQSQVRYKAMLETPLLTVGVCQRKCEMIRATAKNKRDREFKDISKHITRVLRHGGCHEVGGSVRWAHVLALLEDAEHTEG